MFSSCSANLLVSFVLCDSSITRITSAQSMSSAVTGVAAFGFVPAPIASTPSYLENTASAVGLRKRFSLQTKRSLGIYLDLD